MSNWAQLVIISFSSAVRVAKRYSKIKIFRGLFGNVEKNCSEKLDFVKNCFHIIPWTNVSVYIAKANVLMGILFILLY